MKTSKQLFARRRELDAEQHRLMDEGSVDEARVLEGQIREIDITLDHVLEEEERERSAYNAAPSAPKSLAERVLGPRDEFRGLQIGFKNEDAGESGESGESGASSLSVVSIAAPAEIELEIPGKQPGLLLNFAATIASKEASGTVHFKQRSTQTGTPDTWGGVDEDTGESATKAKVLYTWKDAVANEETIAGYTPVSKQTLRDYDELAAIIESDLMIDLSEKRNAKLLTGSNSSGIVGALNTVGIQSFATHMGGLYWEAIRKMRTACMKNGRAIPTHVCMHPDIKEAIDLYKTQQGFYQQLDTFWGMIPVEDFDCAGILVYDSYAMMRRPIHGLTVEVGYVNDQFIKNELCILAEETLAFQVKRPDALVYATKANLDAN